MFMSPDTAPAYGFARSIVVAQYAATLKNNMPSPSERNITDRYGSDVAAPREIKSDAPSGQQNPMPHRLMRFPYRRLSLSDSQPPIGAAAALIKKGAVLNQPPLTNEKPRTLTRYR